MASTATSAAGAAVSQFARGATFRRNPYWAMQRKPRDQSKYFMRRLAMAGGGTDGKGRPLPMKQSWNVVTGDLVQVASTGRKRDKDNKGKWLKNSDGTYVAEDWLGAQGKVLAVLRRSGRIVVQGVNMKTRIAQVRQANASAQTSEAGVEGGAAQRQPLQTARSLVRCLSLSLRSFACSRRLSRRAISTRWSLLFRISTCVWWIRRRMRRSRVW